MKLLALMADTVREVYSKKIIAGLVVVELLILGITALVLFLPGMQAEYDEASDMSYRQPPPAQRSYGSAARERSDTSWKSDSLSLLGDSTWIDSTEQGGEDSRVFSPADTGSSRGVSNDNEESGPRALVEKVRGQLSTIPVVLSLAVLFLGLFATADVVPSMMRKGTIELLLSKPLSRPVLLFGRVAGGVAVMGINHLVFVVGIWTIYGAASGVWLNGFLLWMTLLPFLAYVTVFSGVVLLSIVTESWVLPLSLAYIHVMILNTFLYGREGSIYRWIEGDWIRWVGESLYWGLPQISDLTNLTMESVYASSLDSVVPIAQSLVFIAVTSTLSAWKFTRKDF